MYKKNVTIQANKKSKRVKKAQNCPKYGKYR